MTCIKIELPEGNASALHRIGEAFQKMAQDIAPDTYSDITESMLEDLSADWQVPVSMLKGESKTPATEEDKKQLEDYHAAQLQALGESMVTPPTLDEAAVADLEVHGEPVLSGVLNDIETITSTNAPEIPWDARIHSKNKTTNQDGSFKKRKKPADMEKDEWESYVEAVEVELKHLMAGTPVVVTDTDNDASTVFNAPVTETPPVVTTPATETLPTVVTPPVTETPPTVVTPPVTETPPVVTETPPVVTETPPVTDEAAPKTFGELMKFVTGNNAVLTPPVCTEVLKANGVESWPLLATKLQAQPEFMNTIYPALKAKL